MKWMALVAGLAMPNGAAAQVTSGNDLLYACDGRAGEVGLGYCTGYVIGALEGIRYGAAVPFWRTGTCTSADEVNSIFETLFSVCLPLESDCLQAKDVVVIYLGQHPETRHEPARMLIHFALQEAFPCPVPEGQPPAPAPE